MKHLLPLLLLLGCDDTPSSCHDGAQLLTFGAAVVQCRRDQTMKVEHLTEGRALVTCTCRENPSQAPKR